MDSQFTWRQILRSWSRVPPTDAPADVPVELAGFLAAGGAGFAVQNRFVVPECEDGWCVFLIENQAVCVWAYRADDPAPDPSVYVREAHSTSYQDIGVQLGEVLAAASLIEAVFGAPTGLGGTCPPAVLDEVLDLPVLDLPDLAWPGGLRTRYYGNAQIVAFAQDQQSEAFVFIGARDTATLAPLAARLDVLNSWETTS